MALDLLAHLKELCAAPGLSGYEPPVRRVIRAAWEPLATRLGEDRLGSLWATKAGSGAEPRPKLMLAAHMDAIGLIVTQVEGDFVRVSPMGGIDARVLPGQVVTVHGREDLPAVVAAPPAFLLPKANREGVTPVAELVVDTGLPAARLRQAVQTGDLVSFAQPAYELLNGYLAAKSLDNRASVAALTACLEALQGREHAWDVVAVATVQEELNLSGAHASAFGLAPAAAVAIDVTFGLDNNTREFGYRALPVGGGPVLGLGPNIHPGLHAALRAAAEKAEIPFSTEPLPGHSGTDAFAIQVAREGIPTGVVSIALRNMHTPVEVVAVKDIARTGRLLADFAAGLGPEAMEGMRLE